MARTTALLAVIATVPACSGDSPTDREEEGDLGPFTFSFEGGAEGWEAAGTDLDAPPIDWHVRPSQAEASDGSASMELFLENLNDQGKIWMQRSFGVEPERQYLIQVRYDFGTSDGGSFNLFRLITGAAPEPPATRDDLVYQGDTGHGGPIDGEVRWLDKSFDLVSGSGSDGEIWVFIGVWGTWETPRSYYVDDVRISFQPI